MSFTLKPFNNLTPKELYAILKARIDVFVVEQNCLYHEADDKDQECYHLFKEEDGIIAAYVRILPRGVSYKEASIGRVLVHKDFRGSGLGYEVMERALKFLEEELCETMIKIQAQAHLEKFYGSFGFQAITLPYDDEGIPHIDMIKK
ncbi:GNAT family N-acetyltransferase [Priestia endophytica]|uniref:GNAT family N-acetyltransferase n=1 Tax=Priestia endophytica TaxID=135735 RepID=UPI000DCA3AC7|nr:GNAT family N-acetyltransferase [Priestia endophytica]RAS86167.1 GNAT family N-acetyltransferase [Priestia endophytica]